MIISRLEILVHSHIERVLAGVYHLCFEKKSLFSYSADKNRFDSDLAILKLDSPLVFDDNVKPICLPDASFEPTTVKGVVSGWGDTIAGTLFLY